jgi:hypothetical protein
MMNRLSAAERALRRRRTAAVEHRGLVLRAGFSRAVPVWAGAAQPPAKTTHPAIKASKSTFYMTVPCGMTPFLGMMTMPSRM